MFFKGERREIGSLGTKSSDIPCLQSNNKDNIIPLKIYFKLILMTHL